MDITSKKSDNELVITLTGALDLTTATLLDNELLLSRKPMAARARMGLGVLLF